MPKNAQKKVAPKKQTKTSFVLTLPHSMPAKDVVAKGKAAGIVLTDKHVWAIRSDAKKKKSKGPGRRAAPKSTGARSAVVAHPRGSHNAEDLLRTAALALGLPRAMAILQGEYERMRRLLG